jgi:hypothetical protein
MMTGNGMADAGRGIPRFRVISNRTNIKYRTRWLM